MNPTVRLGDNASKKISWIMSGAYGSNPLVDDILVYADSPNPNLDLTSKISGVVRCTPTQLHKLLDNTAMHNVVDLINNTSIKYDLDPAFMAADAILETNWGQSDFAKSRHNWYGYEAWASNPNAAKYFDTDSEGIDVPLKDIHDNYCTPGGMFYNNGNGTTLGGWYSKWCGVDGVWQQAAQTLINLVKQICAQ